MSTTCTKTRRSDSPVLPTNAKRQTLAGFELDNLDNLAAGFQPCFRVGTLGGLHVSIEIATRR